MIKLDQVADGKYFHLFGHEVVMVESRDDMPGHIYFRDEMPGHIYFRDEMGEMYNVPKAMFLKHAWQEVTAEQISGMFKFEEQQRLAEVLLPGVINLGQASSARFQALKDNVLEMVERFKEPDEH